VVNDLLETVKLITDLGLAVFLVVYLIVRLDRTLGDMRDKLTLILKVLEDRDSKKLWVRSEDERRT
jgi:hypothetical protein